MTRAAASPCVGRLALRRLLAAALLLCSLLFGATAYASEPADGSLDADAAASSNLINPQQRPDSSAIYDTLISDLAGADSYYNGQTVQVTGEAVGDSIVAVLDGSYRWITLQATDASYAQVTVYMKKEAASAIDTFGAYGKTGSTVQVRGVFNLACSDHEGQSDIHAEYVSVIERGSVHRDEFVAADFLPGFGLCLAAGVIVLVYYRMRERQR